MSTTADLLASSREAHRTYRLNIPHKSAQGAQIVTIPGNPAAARAALQDASDLRVAADWDDPAHLDPAWLMDPVSHSELMDFYAKELAK